MASGKRGRFVRKIFGKIMKEENYFINRKIPLNSVFKVEIMNKQKKEYGVAYLKYLHGRL